MPTQQPYYISIDSSRGVLSRIFENPDFFVWGMFLLVILVFAIFSAIFIYHWKNFSIGHSIYKFLSFYFVVSSVLILFMFISALLFVNS